MSEQSALSEAKQVLLNDRGADAVEGSKEPDDDED